MSKKSKSKTIVPDTSVLIDGILTDRIEKENISKGTEVIVPGFVIGELRAQASKGREIGFKGMEELKKLRKLSEKDIIKFSRKGRKQTLEEIKLAKSGRVDALILEMASEENAVLYTSDRVQALNAEVEGVSVEYFEPYEKEKTTTIEEMFEKDYMSIHLKENTIPLAKRGDPGNIKLEKISDKKFTKKKMEKMAKEIMDAARYEEDSFIELGGHKASVVQLGNIRISIARPPFSDGIEITAVRPVAKVGIEDYDMADKLKERLKEKAEGILIAGPPGSGKSTFASALGEFYESQEKIVKTMESPRDLQVKDEITQYTRLHGSYEKTSDLILLVRPDYTVFDEVRKTEEFEVFSDMRLAGIGMLGVVHATEAIDAVQRFIGRVELGMIPSIMDTIVYIKGGKIEKVYYVKLIVKTPTGMTEADLARPVVEVRDFESNKLAYEIYTYGEENVIVPVEEGEADKESSVKNLAKKTIVKEMKKYDQSPDVTFTSENRVTVKVDNENIARIIGKNGSNIDKIEDKLGIGIDVLPKTKTFGNEVDFDVSETGANVILEFDDHYAGKTANFYEGKEYILSAAIGKNGQIRIKKDSEMGEEIMNALIKKKLKAYV